MCGEHRDTLQLHFCHLGSPPRVRGKPGYFVLFTNSARTPNGVIKTASKITTNIQSPLFSNVIQFVNTHMWKI